MLSHYWDLTWWTKRTASKSEDSTLKHTFGWILFLQFWNMLTINQQCLEIISQNCTNNSQDKSRETHFSWGWFCADPQQWHTPPEKTQTVHIIALWPLQQWIWNRATDKWLTRMETVRIISLSLYHFPSWIKNQYKYKELLHLCLCITHYINRIQNVSYRDVGIYFASYFPLLPTFMLN